MSDHEWETRWKHEPTIDAYHELVATMADEVVPVAAVMSTGFRHAIAADFILWLINDAEMRELFVTLLSVKEPL